MPQEPSPSRRRGVAALVVRENRLLVIRRGRLVVAPGAICFPGGGIEPGESESEALVRELQEELGIAVTPHECVWRSLTPWGVEMAWWRAEFDNRTQPTANPQEVEASYWLTPEELLARDDLLQSNREFLQAAAERPELLNLR